MFMRGNTGTNSMNTLNQNTTQTALTIASANEAANKAAALTGGPAVPGIHKT